MPRAGIQGCACRTASKSRNGFSSAIGPKGKLLIAEGVYPKRIDQSPESRGAAANDVNMLVCTGGRQRSEREFRALYEAAGFALSKIVPTASPAVSLIEGIPI